MRLSYEDENFNRKEITENFDIYVQGNSWYYEPIIDEPVYVEPVVEENNTTKYVIAGALIIVLVVGIVVYRKKKQSKGVIDDEDL